MLIVLRRCPARKLHLFIFSIRREQEKREMNIRRKNILHLSVERDWVLFFFLEKNKERMENALNFAYTPDRDPTTTTT